MQLERLRRAAEMIFFPLALLEPSRHNLSIMPEGVQGEFVFVEGWTGDGRPLPPSLDDEIAAAWHVPVGQRVHVTLRQHDVPGASGLLVIAHAPDWPFDPRRPLALRIVHVLFTHLQIESWTLL